jgi:hypothetical protein
MEVSLSKYEQERLDTIQSNRAKLVELGLEPAEAAQEAPKTKAKRERRPADAMPQEPTRQSKRARSAAPDYTGVKIDAFGDDEPRLFRSMRRSSTAEDDVSDVGNDPEAAKRTKEEAAAAVREAALAWASLRKERASSSAPLAQDAEGWRAEAVRRWGDKAGLAETDDWEAYVVSRTATPPPPSPLEMMQVRAAGPGSGQSRAQAVWLPCTRGKRCRALAGAEWLKVGRQPALVAGKVCAAAAGDASLVGAAALEGDQLDGGGWTDARPHYSAFALACTNWLVRTETRQPFSICTLPTSPAPTLPTGALHARAVEDVDELRVDDPVLL